MFLPLNLSRTQILVTVAAILGVAGFLILIFLSPPVGADQPSQEVKMRKTLQHIPDGTLIQLKTGELEMVIGVGNNRLFTVQKIGGDRLERDLLFGKFLSNVERVINPHDNWLMYNLGVGNFLKQNFPDLMGHDNE